ncbi:MAG: helix-turn-helix domain-containing protein [Candidatus Bathyarchaeia archaeon]
MRNSWREPYHVVLEVENKQCRMLQKLALFGIEHLKVVDIRSSSVGVVKHLIELGFNQAEKIPRELKVAARKGKSKDKRAIWFESEGCEVCNTILIYDAFLVSGKSVEKNVIMYSFMVPTFEAYSGIIKALEATGHKVIVRKIGKFDPKTEMLTAKQERLFWVALKSGFFDYPRKIGLQELSAKLGVKPATLSETIRRGTRRLLEHYFEKETT